MLCAKLRLLCSTTHCARKLVRRNNVVRFTRARRYFNSTEQSASTVLHRLFPAMRNTQNRTIFGLAFLGGAGVTLMASCSEKRKDKLLNDFLMASKEGDIKILKRALEDGIDVNSRHPLGWTALHVACINGHVDAVKLLLSNGADPDLGDNFTNSTQAAKDNELNVIQVVMQREEEFSNRLNLRTTFCGCTALHYAVLANHDEIWKILLEGGADPTRVNDMGHIPADYTKDRTAKEMLLKYAEEFEEIRAQKEIEERRRYPLEKRLKEKIVGQEGAINEVAAAVRRKENGWYDEDHPLVLLFLGSSGIGKTELAKQMANYLSKDRYKFIRLDMSEYQEKHEVAKLIGAPPGYLGHDRGGQLTRQLTEAPLSVVLFDEVDKAHPDVLSILLQLFDEGRLTDGKGKTVECKKAIFVMTSNLANEEIADHATQLRKEAHDVSEKRKGGKRDDLSSPDHVTISREFKDKIVRPILKRHFRRDEFLGRINEIVYFLPFSRPELMELVAMELRHWAKRAMDKHSIDLTWDHEVLDVVANGYVVYYGARSIKHEVERLIVSSLALAHERGEIDKGFSVHVGIDGSVADLLDKGGTATPASIKMSVKPKEGNKLNDIVGKITGGKNPLRNYFISG